MTIKPIIGEVKAQPINDNFSFLASQFTSFNGSPKGAYQTLSDLQNAFPNGSIGVYVVSADGKWYYWNGSAWTVGGIYQSTGIANGTVKPINTTFIKTTINKFDKTSLVTGGYLDGSGAVVTQPEYSQIDFIEVKPNTVYAHNFVVAWPPIVFYDENKKVIKDVWIDWNVWRYGKIQVPGNSNIKYMRTSIKNNENSNGIMIAEGDTLPNEYIPRFQSEVDPGVEYLDRNLSKSSVKNTTYTTANDRLSAIETETYKQAQNYIRNGTFNGTTYWNAVGGNNNVSSGMMSITGDGTLDRIGANQILASYKGTTGNKMFVKVRFRVNSPISIGLNVYASYNANIAYANNTSYNIKNLTSGFWYEFYGLITTPVEFNGNDITIHFVSRYKDKTHSNGVKMDIYRPFTTDLTKVFGAGKEPTAEEFYSLLNKRFTGAFFDGTENLFNPKVAILPNETLNNGTNPYTNSNFTETLDTKSPLLLKNPFGYHQPYHPKVLYFVDKFNGYNYWMSESPYPKGTGIPGRMDRYENPVVHASNDGINWTNGTMLDDLAPDEIIAESYYSDPHLVYREDTKTLECWYRKTIVEPFTCYIYRRTTTDGVNWTTKEKVINATSDYGDVISPAIIFEGGLYKIWYKIPGGEVYYMTSPDAINWSPRQLVVNDVPSAVWHLDIYKHENNYYRLDYSTQGGPDRNRDALTIYKSIDGINFNFVNYVLFTKKNTFYERNLYRSCLVHNGEEWRVYFSGGTEKYNSVGIMRGDSLETLEVVDGGLKRGRLQARGGIELGSSPLILHDSGVCIGYDDDTKAIYYQRADGSRVVIGR